MSDSVLQDYIPEITQLIAFGTTHSVILVWISFNSKATRCAQGLKEILKLPSNRRQSFHRDLSSLDLHSHIRIVGAAIKAAASSCVQLLACITANGLKLVTHAAEVTDIAADLGLRVGVVGDPHAKLGKVFGGTGVGVVVGNARVLVICKGGVSGLIEMC